jgi:hypothetical protein
VADETLFFATSSPCHEKREPTRSRLITAL